MASWDDNQRRSHGNFHVVLLIVLFILALGIVGRMDKDDALRSNTPVRCEEDMACWDCKTMGNRICGPTR